MRRERAERASESDGWTQRAVSHPLHLRSRARTILLGLPVLALLVFARPAESSPRFHAADGEQVAAPLVEHPSQSLDPLDAVVLLDDSLQDDSDTRLVSRIQGDLSLGMGNRSSWRSSVSTSIGAHHPRSLIIRLAPKHSPPSLSL